MLFRSLVFRNTSSELQGPGLYWTRSDGAVPPVRILEGTAWQVRQFSPDGKRLLYADTSGFGDLWTLPLDAVDSDNPKPGKPELFLRADRPIRQAAFSPDGKWVVYSGGQTGAPADVRPFPGPGGVWQISSGAADEVFWPRNGQVLFNNRGTIQQVDYTAAKIGRAHV